MAGDTGDTSYNDAEERNEEDLQLSEFFNRFILINYITSI